MHDFAFERVSRDIEELHRRNGSHRLVIGKRPDDLLIRGDFNQVWRFSETACGQPSWTSQVQFNESIEFNFE